MAMVALGVVVIVTNQHLVAINPIQGIFIAIRISFAPIQLSNLHFYNHAIS